MECSLFDAPSGHALPGSTGIDVGPASGAHDAPCTGSSRHSVTLHPTASQRVPSRNLQADIFEREVTLLVRTDLCVRQTALSVLKPSFSPFARQERENAALKDIYRNSRGQESSPSPQPVIFSFHDPARTARTSRFRTFRAPPADSLRFGRRGRTRRLGHGPHAMQLPCRRSTLVDVPLPPPPRLTSLPPCSDTRRRGLGQS